MGGTLAPWELRHNGEQVEVEGEDSASCPGILASRARELLERFGLERPEEIARAMRISRARARQLARRLAREEGGEQ